MILIGKKSSGNYKDLDKTCVKLSPNSTRHHLITHTNFFLEFTNNDDLKKGNHRKLIYDGLRLEKNISLMSRF